jgi:hypothetical protein
LRELAADSAPRTARLFAPRSAARGFVDLPLQEVDLVLPENLPHGALIHYLLGADTPNAAVEILDARGSVVRRFDTNGKGVDKLATQAGFHRVVWNLRGQGPVGGKADDGEDRPAPGVKMPPGRYTVRLTAGAVVQTQPLIVTGNPSAPAITQADYDAQHALATALRESVTEVNRVLADVQAVRKALTATSSAARALDAALNGVEMAIKPVAVPGQIGVPAGLAAHYDTLYGTLVGDGGYGAGSAEGRPTASRYQRQAALDGQWQALRARLQAIAGGELARYNDEARQRGLPELRLAAM